MTLQRNVGDTAFMLLPCDNRREGVFVIQVRIIGKFELRGGVCYYRVEGNNGSWFDQVYEDALYDDADTCVNDNKHVILLS